MSHKKAHIDRTLIKDKILKTNVDFTGAEVRRTQAKLSDEYTQDPIIRIHPIGQLAISVNAWDCLGRPERVMIYKKAGLTAIKGTNLPGSCKVLGQRNGGRIFRVTHKQYVRDVGQLNGGMVSYYYGVINDGYLIFDHNDPYHVEEYKPVKRTRRKEKPNEIR